MNQCQDWLIKNIIFVQISISMKEDHQSSESFYSINNSKSKLTFIEEQKSVEEEGFLPSSQLSPQEPIPINVKNILEKFDIRQSSAVELQSQEVLNQSFHSVASGINRPINLHDISAIDHPNFNELECSVCLQDQIQSLSVPHQASPQQMKILQEKVARLKTDQSILRKQINLFQEAILLSQQKNRDIAEEVMKVNKFIKKKCEHNTQSAPPFNISLSSQITAKTQQPIIAKLKEEPQRKKHFDIKPSRGQSASQKEANAKYKECSFNRHVVLLEDKDNQFRVELTYEMNSLIITLLNLQTGETNFLHAVRVNQPDFFDKVSERVVYPLRGHVDKKFTLSLSIMLLIFEQKKEKEQSNLIKIEEIRSVSVPLPLNYLIDQRFIGIPRDDELLQRIYKRLYIYEIDINSNGDYAAFKVLTSFQWVREKWISLRGKNGLIWVEIEEMKEREGGGFGVVFMVGCKDKDCQDAIDLIEYLCFMLAL